MPTIATAPPTGGVAARVVGLVERALGVSIPIGVRAWDGSQAGPRDGPIAVLRSRRALRYLLWSPGELGLARAYVSGDLDIEGDLSEALRRVWDVLRTTADRPKTITPAIVLTGLSTLARAGAVGARPSPPAAEIRVSGRLHSRRRDHAVVAGHYDFGNEFYTRVLDPTMAYSCAYFADVADDDESLEDAQRAKLDLICSKLKLAPGQRLLDVGCGWGSLLLHAAERYGVHVTGVTLANEQAAYIAAQVARRGLGHLIDVRRQDYRDLDSWPTERYDAVASIEMGEHVGAANYPTYAALLHRMVRPGGRLVIQQMSRGASAPGGGAFIEAYITADMTMSPLPTTLAHLESAGFEIRGVEALREQYVRTIRAWAKNLDHNRSELTALVGEQSVRVWRLYLAGAAMAFEESRMGVNQILATRAAASSA